ncbi:uncharacterized protein LOC123310122 isoform X2 [Coccinella septempunctata]|uniref:uncharacterized protein LOC123310122 isoform X2 n=1 Tax=Coccinella septempunctata TaxID=41139 RepID=UPI001D063408|nr:uncharacterized protein LOC123310122 isoform X2 [Coccinella septempunctata]
MNYALPLITSRRLNMKSKVVFFAFLNFLLVSSGYSEPSQATNNLVTQTVYGFLDFTTTIGNTVMIFSPQSSEVKQIDISTTPSTPKKEVIESKPPNPITTSSIDIKPSKIVKAVENKPTKPLEKIVTVVNVISESSQLSDNKITKPQPFSEVNVIKASTENVAKTPLIISSRVEVVEAATTKLPPSIISKVEVLSGPVASSKIDIITNKDIEAVPDVEDSSLIFGNNIGEPEYEFLSRQPSEVVEETYKVINFKPASSKFILKPRQSNDHKHKATTKKNNSIHPTGLVTKLGGTLVKDGTTIVHETSVIGTFISGKYAQVLQSSSHVVGSSPKGKISASPTLRILKTAAPSGPKAGKRHLEPTPSASINEETAVENSQSNSFKPGKKNGQKRFKNRPNEEAHSNKEDNRERSSQGSKKKSSGRSNARSSNDDESSPPTTRKYQSSGGRRNKQNRSNPSESAINNSNGGGFSRRAYKPKVQTSSVEAGASTKLYKFKLNRSPGRWQYKTTPKPRVTIRKQNNHSTEEDEYKNETSQLTAAAAAPRPAGDASSLSNEASAPQSRQQEDADGLEGSESVASIIDDGGAIENKLDAPSFPLETIKVEISTPPDFKDIYYEIATIKSPYTFQVGSVKNTRFITVTSTFEKSLINTEEPTVSPTPSAPLTENILATSSNYDKDNNFLDSSIATLPPIYLGSDMETPPLETVTETFSTTETMLKTHILPIIRSPNDTTTSSLIQTYLITRLVTATKTKPPMEAYDFVPSKTLKEFNSHLDEAGSELHLELEFGDQNEQDEGVPKRVFPPDIDLSDIGSKFDLSDVDKNRVPEGHLRLKKAHSTTSKNQLLPDLNSASNFSPDQLQQLAFLRLLNPAAALQQPQVITTSKPVLRVETSYESYVIPITNGQHTFATTLSKIVGTVTRTEYEYATSTISPGMPQQLQFPQAPLNPLFPPVPQAQIQFTVTSSPVVQTTTVTETRSKVLKITFGAKTAYTTVLSSTVVPTVLTTYVTSSVPVQPTAAFPGFFPAPYPPYPYVG